MHIIEHHHRILLQQRIRIQRLHQHPIRNELDLRLFIFVCVEANLIGDLAIMETGLFADALADAGAGDAPGESDADAFLQGVAGLD